MHVEVAEVRTGCVGGLGSVAGVASWMMGVVVIPPSSRWRVCLVRSCMTRAAVEAVASLLKRLRHRTVVEEIRPDGRSSNSAFWKFRDELSISCREGAAITCHWAGRHDDFAVVRRPLGDSGQPLWRDRRVGSRPGALAGPMPTSIGSARCVVPALARWPARPDSIFQLADPLLRRFTATFSFGTPRGGPTGRYADKCCPCAVSINATSTTSWRHALPVGATRLSMRAEPHRDRRRPALRRRRRS
jgi:hypothetical protein